MKIKLLVVGKTGSKPLEEMISDYQSRLKRYIQFEIETIPELKNTKNLSASEQKRKEAEAVSTRISATDTLILLDEKGDEYSSVGLARKLQNLMNSGVRNLVLLVGGPYGIDDSLKLKSHGSISLSKLTFSHQMVRLFVVEQLYRAMTILKNQPYHHE